MRPEKILDRAQIELAFGRAVLGDVSEPQLVGCSGPERAPHEVVVDRLSGRGSPAPPAGEDRPDAVSAAQALDPVLARGDAALRGELVGDEAVAEDRIV